MASSSPSSARRFVVVVVAMAVLVSSGCASGQDDGDPGDSVTGVVSQVRGSDTTVDAFVIVDDEGSSHLFVPGAGLTCDGEPVVHLRTHLIERDRLRVTYAMKANGALEATRIVHMDG